MVVLLCVGNLQIVFSKIEYLETDRCSQKEVVQDLTMFYGNRNDMSVWFTLLGGHYSFF